MIHINKEHDFIEIEKQEYAYAFDRESMCFRGVNFGGKISISFQKDRNIIFNVAGHTGSYTFRRTKYYPPEYMIGTLENGVFTQHYKITYTRKHAREAKEKALELIGEIISQEEGI